MYRTLYKYASFQQQWQCCHSLNANAYQCRYKEAQALAFAVIRTSAQFCHICSGRVRVVCAE